jgi:methionine-S-sulfoxide reductase
MRASWRRASWRPRPVVGIATLAAGPFEQVEAEFRGLPGVLDTAVGYSGGSRPNPTYGQVRGGGTGHVEAVQVEFDPRRVFYAELLETFWRIHDPTDGAQAARHRSAIFTHTPEQQRIAQASLFAAQARFGRPLLTRIARADAFYRAEDEHQHLLERRGLTVALL